MTTIKFSRPDGEARLEWQERGHVLIRVATTAVTYSGPRDAEYVEHFLSNYVPHSGDRSAILLAAEKLRNEKRKLAEDGSEWRGEAAVYTFSAPDHKCDTPRCVNPDHLFAGTLADNTADMVAKGRAKGIPGPRNVSAKMTEDAVLEMRVRRAQGETERSLALAFGISPTQTHGICVGETWRSVGGPIRAARKLNAVERLVGK